VFGPLAHAWKSQVTGASQANIPITRDNLLQYYHKARSTALKPTTIQAAFKRTGIYPLDRNAIAASAFEPAKISTTQAAQPLPARLPSSLVPTPNPSPMTSVAATPVTSAAPASHDLDVGTLEVMDSGAPTPAEVAIAAAPTHEAEQVQRYHIELPPPIPHTASRQALREENAMLRKVIERAGVELERDFAQMKLMDFRRGTPHDSPRDDRLPRTTDMGNWNG